MRSEKEMFDLILKTAREEDVRVVAHLERMHSLPADATEMY